MSHEELEATLRLLTKFRVREWGVSTAGPYVTFFAPEERAMPDALEPSETGQPKPGLALRDLLWSTPEWGDENQEAAARDEKP